MNFFQGFPDHEEIPQHFIQALRDEKICLSIAHAACVLMAANPDLSPHDAAWDACQTYCHLLDVRSGQADAVS